MRKISNLKNLELFLLIIFISLRLSGQSQIENLIISSNSVVEQKLIDSLKYKSQFKNGTELENEINRIKEILYYKGFITLKSLGIFKLENKHSLLLDLGPAYQSVLLTKHSKFLNDIGFELKKDNLNYEKFVEIPISKLKESMEKISKELSNKGYPFATVKIINIKPIEEFKLKTELLIDKGEIRRIDSVTILGYEEFSKGHLKHMLKLKLKDPFNLTNLQTKMQLLDQLSFANQKRSPEVLFNKNKTTLFLYIDKIKSNNFDGFLGFGSNESNGKMEFNGYLNLKLENNLNYGESINLSYKNDDIGQKTIDIMLNMPYLFSSPLGGMARLNIFKKDSLFTTAEQSFKLSYNFTAQSEVGASANFNQSNTINNNLASNLENYESNFYGINYYYTKKNRLNNFFPLQMKINLLLAFGSRVTSKSSNQRKILFEGSRIFMFNKKNNFFVRFLFEDLKSDYYLLNEMFRFGGINSVRGFQENSLFASRYFMACSEYRYMISQTLYVHSVFDSAYLEDISSESNRIYGIGFGFGVKTASGLLKFTYANGKLSKQSFDLSKSKVHLSLVSNF
tara:strand:+ start:160972 stop:162672 length:1701 start_codon:yes stop_codon:yes gene_type:complete